MSKLKDMRTIKRMTQKELACKLNVSIPTVSTMEKKGIFDTRSAVRYAKALKCSPFFLLEGLDTEYNSSNITKERE